MGLCPKVFQLCSSTCLCFKRPFQSFYDWKINVFTSLVSSEVANTCVLPYASSPIWMNCSLPPYCPRKLQQVTLVPSLSVHGSIYGAGHEHQHALGDVQFIFDMVVTDEWIFAPWLCEGIWSISWGFLIDQSNDMGLGLPFAYTPHWHVETYTLTKSLKDLARKLAQDHDDVGSNLASSQVYWIKVSCLSSEWVRMALSQEPNSSKWEWWW